ncbi:MAG: elongation factor G, partial [Deltaproteobacteria bacterium]
ERALRVLDGAIGVFCAVGGVEPQSETVWHQADRYRVPKIAFVNKLDRIGADFFKVVESMREKLGTVPLVLQIPWGVEDQFRGVIDLIGLKAIVWKDETLGASYDEVPIPDDLLEKTSEFREKLLETLADKNDLIMEKYLAEEQIGEAEIKAAVRDATVTLQVTPVFCGSALRNKGIQPLLDAITDYLPSPMDVPAIVGTVPDTGEKEKRPPDPKGPFSALAFKVMMDQGRKMTYLRVYSGTIEAGKPVFNSAKGITEKLSRLLRMHSNKRERIASASAGDIVAAMGLKLTATGDTLCHEDASILLEPIRFNEPVITMAVEPKRVQDQDKLVEVLGKLSDEDPTFKYKIDEETGQTVISGMGELHLEILVGRMKREFSVDTNQGKPQVVYRESISKTVSHEEIFERELGGQHHYAGVALEIAPQARGEGNRFVDKCKNSSLSEEFLAAIREGVTESENSGVMMGYPVIDVRTTLLDVQIKESLSDVMAFKIAAAMAFKKACNEAAPLLLEPIMKAEVIVPDDFMGEVIGELNARKGKVEQIKNNGPVQVITASVPLSKMFGYSTALRSVSQGRGTFTMQFSHFDQA